MSIYVEGRIWQEEIGGGNPPPTSRKEFYYEKVQEDPHGSDHGGDHINGNRHGGERVFCIRF